jgi:hypothetical protein
MKMGYFRANWLLRIRANARPEECGVHKLQCGHQSPTEAKTQLNTLVIRQAAGKTLQISTQPEYLHRIKKLTPGYFREDREHVFFRER